jgi:DnaJ family protein B protein 4
METDYYVVLGVGRAATDEDVKRAYREKAMKWHPDRNKGNEQAAEVKFKEIGEAFSVLGDGYKRAIYDAGGSEEEYKAEPSDNPSKRRTYAHKFSKDDAENLFAQMFSAQLYGMYGADSVLLRAMNGTLNENMERPRGRAAGARRKADEIVRDLHVPLENLYMGAVKKFKVERKVFDNTDKMDVIETVVEVDIKPGWKTGTKVTFEKHGDEDASGCDPADLTFIIKQIEHPIYRREGNDLVCPVVISLGKALTNPTLPLRTLDGRPLNVHMDEIITPNYRKTIKGEGMPVARDPKLRGDLHLDFTVMFPTSLTPMQRAVIAQHFP